MDKKNYKSIFDKVKGIIKNEDNDIEKYNFIGEILKENKSNFDGESLITNLSADLNKKGYSVSSLRHMQNFHKRFRNYPNLYELSKKISWNKIITLLKTYDIKETEYYLKESIKEKWSNAKLKKAIEDDTFDNYINFIESSDYKINIDEVVMKNYKSLVDINIKQPSRFSAFVGANASGKSNILEALEFMFHAMIINNATVVEMFGGEKNVLNRNMLSESLNIELKFKDKIEFGIKYKDNKIIETKTESEKFNDKFIKSFTRVFINKTNQNNNKLKFQDKLWFDTGNLTKILSKILKDEDKRELFEIKLDTFIPGFDKIKVKIDSLDSKEELQIFEKETNSPFTGQLISDGTYSVIALLSLLYQSNEPQFLCIEEPENGLNPKIITQFVKLFRYFCENKGHYIWITTHSQTLVSALKPQEIIIVEKENAKTKVTQFNKDEYLIKENEKGELPMDEAWLNNMLGGLPW